MKMHNDQLSNIKLRTNYLAPHPYENGKKMNVKEEEICVE